MRPIDADALIEFCAERWIPLNIDAVNMQPTIQPEKAQLSQQGATSDLISRQAAIDAIEKMNIPEDMCVFEILSHIEVEIATLPTIQPVATDTNVGDTISRQAAIDALKEHRALYCDNTPETFLKLSYVEKSRVDELDTAIATLVNLPPAQPEPQWIPIERELPEDFTDVLVWFEYFRYGDYNCLYQTHGIGTYVANYNLWTVNHETGWKDLRVIAWMPLPEAYKPNNK